MSDADPLHVPTERYRDHVRHAAFLGGLALAMAAVLFFAWQATAAEPAERLLAGAGRDRAWLLDPTTPTEELRVHALSTRNALEGLAGVMGPWDGVSSSCT